MGEGLVDLRAARIVARYDALAREGKHGHYETLFRVVREECELEFSRGFKSGREAAAKVAEASSTECNAGQIIAASIRALTPPDGE